MSVTGPTFRLDKNSPDHNSDWTEIHWIIIHGSTNVQAGQKLTAPQFKIGQYTSLSVCVTVCDWTKNQTEPKVTRPKIKSDQKPLLCGKPFNDVDV